VHLITKKEGTMKNVIVIIGVIMLVSAGVVGYYMWNKKPADIHNKEAQLAINSNELFSAFEANETEANKKFLDKVVAVKGEVTEVHADKDGQYDILLKTDSELGNIVCKFYTEDSASAKTIVPGTTVQIKGVCTGVLMDVVLIKCSLLN
jgi:hypothetical protein